jgi:hypothetical protein
MIGADRAVAGAAAVIGRDGVASAVPLLQPLALSAGTRRAIAGHDGLLGQTRAAAAAASGGPDQELARLQRVRPKTLLAIAAAAGAFYYLLLKGQLAEVPSSWRAIQSADWAWVPLVIAMSAVTYLGGAVALLGAVPARIRFWPTVLAQGASSFINRVSAANVGGMALNVRFLQKSGVEPSAGVAAVGVNSLAGAVVHLILMVVFFTWAGKGLGKAFHLPSGGHVAPGGGNPVGRYGVAITVGSFNFAEGVLPAEIYGPALAAHNYAVRILPILGTRGPVDPALMIGLRQLVPKCAGPAEAWLRGQGLMQAGGVGR